MLTEKFILLSMSQSAWKQCVKFSNFKDIISGITQGSMIDPILFNVSINDNQFFFIEPFTFHNFANALSAWATTVSNVTNNLESNSNIATE